jgi:hypothetical protein
MTGLREEMAARGRERRLRDGEVRELESEVKP